MENVKPIKAFFGRTGGKHFSKKSILPFVKDLEYDTYVEPFVGAGSIFLGRDKKVQREIINDYDNLVINLWSGMKECGDKLNDYKSYFMSKSVFKWWLLKEKQNRRERMKKGNFKGDKFLCYEIYKDYNWKTIEVLKEDYIVQKFSNGYGTRNSPNKNMLNVCYCEKSPNSTMKIEELKEELYLIKKSWFGDNKQNVNNKDFPNKVLNMNFMSLQLYKSKKDVKIETLKEDLFLYSKSFCGNNKNPQNCRSNCSRNTVNKKKDVKIETLKEELYIHKNREYGTHYTTDDTFKPHKLINKYCGCIKEKNEEPVRKTQELKVEELKEDLFLYSKSFSNNNNTPNKKDLKSNVCRHIDDKQLDNKEEIADEDVCCSIEKTEEGLTLIKKKFFVKNKKKEDKPENWRVHNPNMCGWSNLLQNSNKYHERLKDVEINQGDYKKMLKYDSPSTVFYFDPPWTKTATGKKGNKCYSGYVELKDFYNSIKELKGKWMCSYNNDKEILETFKEHKIEYINTTYTQKKEGNKKTVDILIFSKNFND